MSSFAHMLAQLEIAFAAFQAHGLKSTTKRDRDFIGRNMTACRVAVEDVTNPLNLDEGRAFFDYITARTKVANRVEFVDYQNAEIDGVRIEEERDGTILRAMSGDRCVASATMRRPYTNGPLWSLSTSDGAHVATCNSGARKALRRVAAQAMLASVTESDLRATTDADLPPVTHSLSAEMTGDTRPVLYFEQDGAYFSYRDRPFYFVDFDFVGPDGMSAGVCPSFATRAPFDVIDFDMPGAGRAVEWFTQEAATAGFRVERAPDYYRTSQPVPCHPDEELADIAFARHPDRDLTSIAEFVVYRATPQEPVKRETFDTFETWRPAYLNLTTHWFSEEYAGRAADMAEEYYTSGLSPLGAANAYCLLVNGKSPQQLRDLVS